MYPAQFSPHSSQFLNPVLPESMEIDSNSTRFEEHFKNINEHDSVLIKENTVKFLTQPDASLENVIALLNTPAKLLHSLNIYFSYNQEIFEPPMERFFAYLTAIENQFIDQLDNLINLELLNQAYDKTSVLSTLNEYIFDFREKFCSSIKKTGIFLFDPGALTPTTILNFTCLSYIPSLHKKKNDIGEGTTSYHLPIRISQIAILCNTYLKQENLILDPHVSLKQTLLCIEKEMHERMGISQNEMSYHPWAPYIEIFNLSSDINLFDYTISELIDTDILKKINKGIDHKIFSGELPLFFNIISNMMKLYFEDLTPVFLGDLLDVLIKYTIHYEIDDYSSTIFSYASKFISDLCTSVEFSYDRNVDYVQHIFCEKKLKIHINSQIFSTYSDVIHKWMDSLYDTETPIVSCTLPFELLFPPSLTGKKREREESQSYGSNSSYQILRYPLKFLKTLSYLTLVGQPKQCFHPEEWSQLINRIGPNTNLSLPFGCLSENTVFPQNFGFLNIVFSMNTDEAERKKQLEYLHQANKKVRVSATLDFENNEIPLEALVDYAQGVPCYLKLKFEKSRFAADFDLTAFFTQIKEGHHQFIQFLELVCALHPDPFTLEQIDLAAQMSVLRNKVFFPEKLTKRVIELIELGEEGDRLLSYPSMRKPDLILDLLTEADLRKDNSRLYKKLTSVLLEMTLEAKNICTKGIPDPYSSSDAQQYLLECVTTYPSLMDQYAEHLVDILKEISRQAPEHPLNGKITLQFLQNCKASDEIERLLTHYTLNFSDVIPISEWDIKECCHLLSLLNYQEVKRDLVLYPSTLTHLLSLLEAALEDEGILEEHNFMKQVEGIVTFIIQRDYLSKTQLETLMRKEMFADYLFSILRSLKHPELELFIKRLANVADLFWSQISDFCALEDKEDLRKLMALFFKQGWNPHPEVVDINQKLYFMISFLRNSLPHLDENKQKWFLLILQGLVKDKPNLNQEEQEGINQLLEYFFISKERTIQRWDISGLKNYPAISKHLLTLCISYPSLLRSLMGFQTYLDIWNTLFTDLLEKGEIHEEEAFQYAHKFMKLIDVKEVLQDPNMIQPLITTLCNHPLLQEKLLKKSYVFSENPYKRFFLNIAGHFAWNVLKTNRVLSEEILSLCARALCDRILVLIKFDMDLVPCEENRVGFLKALMRLLKNSEEYTIKNQPKVLISLWETYLTDYALYKSNPNSELYQTLVDGGEVIITVILETPEKEPLLSLFQFLEAEFEANPNVMRDVMNRLLGPNTFFLKGWNLRSLLSIITYLPTLSENAQKNCFRLLQNTPFANSHELVFSRQPLFLNKRLKSLNKIPLLGRLRSEAIKLLCLPLRSENGEVIPKLLSKLAPLSESELMLICQSQKTHMAQCLGRELNEKEKGCLELSKYKPDGTAIQKVRRFIEKPHTPPIDVNQISDIRSILSLFDLINFNDSHCSHYVNPSFLILDGKKIAPSQFRGNIEGLINNVLKREKITAVPENEEERELFYRDLHQYLAHIAHIIGQQDPAACTACFLALGEIGAKCGTQYLELPGLYHSLVQQAEIPLVPHWISPQLIAQSAESLNNSLYKETSDGFTTRTAINHLKCFLSRDINNGLTFKVPLKDHEVRYYYALINKKASLIYYLLETFPSNLREEILAKIAKLELNSPAELLKELQKIEHVLSLAWLLPYRKKYDLDIESIRGVMSSLIQSEFKKEKESDVSKKFKKILNDIYTMDDTTAKQTITLLSEALTGDNVSTRLEDLLSSRGSKQALNQPITLQDKLEIVLHDRRWKYLRDKLAQQPDMFSVNVHNRKFIEQEVSQPMGIYHAHSNLKAYEDRHVEPKTKDLVKKLIGGFIFDHHTIFFLNAIKEEISKTIPFGDLTDWFMLHHPKEMTWDDFQRGLYNDSYEFQDKWILYMLEKMGFIFEDGS